MKLAQNMVLALVLMVLMVLPAFAETTAPTKEAVVRLIMSETKNKVQRPEAHRIVNATYKEAAKYGFDPFFLFAMMRTESTFNPKARSRYGARGLMQVVPRWHRAKIRGRNIVNIETNIEVGAEVFAECLENKKGYIKKALKCYSGGARNYATKLKVRHSELQKADIIYRFENELPIEGLSKFEEHKLNISLNPVQALAPQEELMVSGIY